MGCTYSIAELHKSVNLQILEIGNIYKNVFRYLEPKPRILKSTEAKSGIKV